MDMVKSTFIFIVGAASGAVLTYFISKDHLKQEANRYAEAEIKDMEDYFISKYAKPVSPTKSVTDEEEKKDDLEIGASSIEAMERPKQLAYNHTETLVDEDGIEYEEIEFDPPFKVDDHPRDDPAEEPYTITPQQYSNGCPEYSKINLYYYAGNNTLIDDEDDLFDNWSIIGGKSTLKRFGEFEEGVVYVRNEKLGSDFEIRRKRGSFTEIGTKN